MRLIKELFFLVPFVFYLVTFLYYISKDKKAFYEREGLKTFKERFGRYNQYWGSKFSWSKVLDPYGGLAPSHIKKTLLILVIVAIIVAFIPS